MDLARRNIAVDRSKIQSFASIKTVADVPIEVIETVQPKNTSDSDLLKVEDDTTKRNKIMVISILSGVGLAIAIVAYLAFRKK